MLTTRIYRAGLSPDQAMSELRNGSGSQFCPRCVEALERIIPKDELDGASRPELLIAS
jgi:HD-GYP domain-containing protein (c-di-GMP phosphodiesterase class II)